MATPLRHLPPADEVQAEVDDFLLVHQRKSLLRFITCGSVDDGKSTLIGRLLFDSKALSEDQLAALESDSRHFGTQGGKRDFALLVDGLSAEREQGITIDVAYRFFATDRRKFIIADTPGHEQYTRNMVTGASTAGLAVILVDARKGVLAQTRRHSRIAHLLGIRHLVLAVNKMDLVGYDEAHFDRIVADYGAFAARAGIRAFTAIPLSALAGDNVISRSPNMPWYSGRPLLQHLEEAPAVPAWASGGFRMPIQWVNRPNQDFRGYAGTIASGSVAVGEEVRILPSGQRSRINRIVTFDGDLSSATAGQAVTLVLADAVDGSRGDVIAGKGAADLAVRDHLDSTLIWMTVEPLVPGRSYWLKIGAQTVAASVSRIREVVDVNDTGPILARPLGLNDIGHCDLVLDRPIAATAYREDRRLGGFILIDRASHATVAAGMIARFTAGPLRSDDATGGPGRIIWLTGSSAAARRNFARQARERLLARGRPSFVLDASVIKDGVGSDLAGAGEDHPEIRRRGREVAKLLSRAGVTVLAALSAPEDEDPPGTKLNISMPPEDWDWVI